MMDLSNQQKNYWELKLVYKSQINVTIEYVKMIMFLQSLEYGDSQTGKTSPLVAAIKWWLRNEMKLSWVKCESYRSYPSVLIQW